MKERDERMSLLKRLGRTKEQAIQEVETAGAAVPAEVQKGTPREPQLRPQTQAQAPAPERVKAPQPAPPAIGESSQPQMAYSFAGKRAVNVQSEAMREFRLAIHQRLVDEMTPAEQELIARGESAREQIKNLISSYCEKELMESPMPMTRGERAAVVEDVCNELLGLGPLEDLLKDDSITEIMVNGPKQVFVERQGRLEPVSTRFYDENHLMSVIERILAPLGRRVDESSPLVDARLADGSRVNIIIPPLSLVGPVVTIRKFSHSALSVDNLVGYGTLSREMAEFLAACVKARLNILVSGGTGSGKTTTLNALSSFIPPTERIVTVEDAAELRLQQTHVVTLESRPANLEGKGAITIRDLVRNALRMRPDRIIVGEVRSGEALDMLQAMNTGHDGSLTTAHANGPRDVLSRLETMVLMAGMELPVRAVRSQVASAIDLIIQQSRIKDGSRKITHVTEVQGMEGDTIVLQDLYRYIQDGWDNEGRAIGHFEGSGLQPGFLEKFRLNGVPVPRFS